MIEEHINSFYKDLDFQRSRQKPSKNDINQIIDTLEAPIGTEETVCFELWRYSDKHLDTNFRDLDYQNPEELISSLKNIRQNPEARRSYHELQGLNYISEKLVETL